MRQKPETHKEPTENINKDTCPTASRQCMAEEKIRIVPVHLRGEERQAALCRRAAVARKRDRQLMGQTCTRFVSK